MKKHTQTLTALALFLAAATGVSTAVHAEDAVAPTLPVPTNFDSKGHIPDGQVCQLENDFGMCDRCAYGQKYTTQQPTPLKGTGPGTPFPEKRVWFCSYEHPWLKSGLF